DYVPTKKVDKTPYEIWHGKAPNLSYLKVWGCEAYVKRDSADKLHQRSIKCIFVGYPKETMGYYFYFPPENKVIVARYGNFLKRDLMSQKFSGRDNDLKDDHMDTLPSENTSEIPVESKSLGSPPELIPVRRGSWRTANYKAAMLDPCKVIWEDAMEEEMNYMKVMKVWIIVDLPPNANVVRSKWLYKKKTDMDGKVHTYKARLVSKGCTQTYRQMDVKTAFMNGRLDEDIYVEQPEGKSDVVFLILYVDDILIMGNNISILKEVKDYLGKCFSMKDLGEAAYILGIKIYIDRSRRLIRLSQSAYIDKILKKYNMYNSKKVYLPMEVKHDLSNELCASTPEEVAYTKKVPYDSANPGKLHWVAVKHILKYLKNMRDTFLVYGGKPDAELDVTGFCDASWQCDKDDTKSQTGYVFVINEGAVDWKSKKQTTHIYTHMNENVKRWSPLYVPQPANEDDVKTYSIFGYTWAFKENMLAARLTPDDNEARLDWCHLIWVGQICKPLLRRIHDVDGIFDQFPSKYKRTPFMEQPPTTILPKQRVNKTKNKGKKANLSPLNLGGAFEDDNVEDNNVMFLGSQFTDNFLMYENVDPTKEEECKGQLDSGLYGYNKCTSRKQSIYHTDGPTRHWNIDWHHASVSNDVDWIRAAVTVPTLINWDMIIAKSADWLDNEHESVRLGNGNHFNKGIGSSLTKVRVNSGTDACTRLVNPLAKVTLTLNPLQTINNPYCSISPLPKSSFIALQNPHWNNAMHDEYNALVKNGTWILVPKPAGINLVRSIWLFKHKFYADGTLSRYKARLVTNGSSQQLGIDCDETFSPVVKPATIRTVLSLAISRYATRVGFYHSRCDSSLFILRQGSQKQYAIELLARAHMTNCNPSRTPVDTDSKLGPKGVPVQDPTLYRSLAGGLQYLTFTRLDISYALQQICLYMHDPGKPHLAALKHILRYIRGTVDFGFHLYSSTTIFLWGTQMRIGQAAPQQGGLLQRHIPANPVQHQRTKHIEIDIHFVRDLVTAGQVRVLHVPSRYQYAKGLPSALFEDFRSNLSVRLPPARTSRAY
nr:hypothetical protein [Tanacetum cinerariifolium]